MVSTPLKNISQIRSFPQVGVKIRTVWNHQVVVDGWTNPLENYANDQNWVHLPWGFRSEDQKNWIHHLEFVSNSGCVLGGVMTNILQHTESSDVFLLCKFFHAIWVSATCSEFELSRTACSFKTGFEFDLGQLQLRISFNQPIKESHSSNLPFFQL